MDFLTESDKVDKLYSCYGLLADCDPNDINKHEKVYIQILKAVKGCEKEKRLVCQFIPVFFKYFPELADMALEAQCDLCEDRDGAIRKQAIKELPALCRECPRITKKVSLILSQLLVVKDQAELRVVHTALMALFKIDASATIIGLCTMIKTGEDAVRNCCLRFLSLRMKNITKDLKDTDAEDVLLKEIQYMLQKSVLEEIPLLLKISMSTSKFLTLPGKYIIANMLIEVIQTEIPFDPTNDKSVERLIILLKHVHLLHTGVKNTRTNRFVLHMCEEILPHLSSFSGFEEGIGYALEILQLLAEITRSVDETTEWDSTINSLLKMLLELIPSPDDELDQIRIQYSYIECLLFTLHRLTKFNRTVFTNDPEKLKNFRKRLQHFACLVKGVCNKLEKNLDLCLEDKTSEASLDNSKKKWFKKDPFLSVVESRMTIKWINPAEPESNIPGSSKSINNDYEKVKQMDYIKKDSLRALSYDTCNNIFILIKDFFANPLTCDTVVELSFFPRSNVTHETPKENKRKHVPSSNDNNSSVGPATIRSNSEDTSIRPTLTRPKMALYIPPSGRYSASFKRSH